MSAVLTPDAFTTVTLGPPQPAATQPPMTRMRFAQQNIQPPAHLFVTPDDFLTLGVVNALTGVTLQVQGRLWTPEGDITLPGFTVSPPADRVLRYTSFQLYYGYLTSVAVWPIGGTLPVGSQTFCSLQLVRPPLASFNLDWPIASGYVTANTFLATPYGAQAPSLTTQGQLYTVTGAAPPAGQDWSQTVPANARWKVRSVLMPFTTGGAAGNRFLGIRAFSGATLLWQSNNPNAIAAGSTVAGLAMMGYPVNSFVAGNYFIPIPTDIPTFAGGTIQSSTPNIQGGDQHGAPILLVEEVLSS